MILYRARWVLPVSARPVEDGVVAVENGRIAFVGAATAAPPGDATNLGDAVLLPGLVNAHTHLELTALRGFLENIEFARWITRLQAVKKAVFDRDRFLDAARLGVAEGLRAGITTYADTCDSGVAFDAMLEAGVRGIMYQEVFGPDPAVAAESLAGLTERVAAMRPRETPLVRVGVSPHAPFTVSDDLYRAVAEYAQRHKLPIAVHIAESAAETDLVARGDGVFADALRRRGITIAARARSPIELLDKVGLLAKRPLLIHCVRIDATDIGHIARTGCAAALCPVSNMTLGHGRAPLAALLDAGIVVGLGSDSMASNPRMDILAESREAMMALCVAGRPDPQGAADALHLATLGGARALGLDRETGSLEVGKSADLAAFPLPAESGPQNPEAVVHGLPGAAASLVVVAGRELVRDGRVLQADAGLALRVDDIVRRVREWAAGE